MKFLLLINVLEQGDSLHKRVSSKHSEHFSSLTKHVLLRFCTPPPHNFEHLSQSKTTIQIDMKIENKEYLTRPRTYVRRRIKTNNFWTQFFFTPRTNT